MYNIIANLLVIASGICWSIVYIQCIRVGFRDKTYCMPLFALGLNIAWEGLYSFLDLFVRHSIGAQAIANTCWFLLDIFIVVTWIRFGKEEFQGEYAKKWFVPWTVLTLASCVVLQLLFVAEFGAEEGEKYSAYLQNIAMSLAFLYMLRERESTKGQTMTIAVCKCIGTLTPTIYGAMGGNTFILVTGIICFVFDVIYIVLLRHMQQVEAAANLTAEAAQ